MVNSPPCKLYNTKPSSSAHSILTRSPRLHLVDWFERIIISDEVILISGYVFGKKRNKVQMTRTTALSVLQGAGVHAYREGSGRILVRPVVLCPLSDCVALTLAGV